MKTILALGGLTVGIIASLLLVASAPGADGGDPEDGAKGPRAGGAGYR